MGATAHPCENHISVLRSLALIGLGGEHLEKPCPWRLAGHWRDSCRPSRGVDRGFDAARVASIACDCGHFYSAAIGAP
jgi:hypothetical protein